MVYGPFNNISLVSGRSLNRAGRKPERLEKKTPDLPVQNLASHVYPERGPTKAVRKPMFKSQRS